MAKRYFPLKQILSAILSAVVGFILRAAVVVLSNMGSWLWEGRPAIPTLEGRWWAGYYEGQLGRQWCVARFAKDPSGRLHMVVLSRFGGPNVFSVERSTSSETVIRFTFTDLVGDSRIEAKQFYVDKRYFFGRLMGGRFRDFWKMNDDVSIRGHSPTQEFAIEPIAEDKLEQFWTKYVRPEQPTPGPADLLRSAGVPL